MFNFDEASQKGKDVMDGMLKGYAEMTRAFQSIATEAADFSKRSCMDGVAHVEAISSVRSPEAAFELQATYLQSSYASGIAEMSKIAEMYADLAKVAYRPFEMPVARTAAPKATTALVPAEQAVNAA